MGILKLVKKDTSIKFGFPLFHIITDATEIQTHRITSRSWQIICLTLSPPIPLWFTLCHTGLTDHF